MLFGKEAVISHFEFVPPLDVIGNMDNEACFIFPVNSVGNVYRQDGCKQVGESEGILMKCGPYINKWNATVKGKNSEVVIIRFLPEILNHLLDNGIRKELNNYNRSKNTVTSEVVTLDLMLEKYLESLFFYFDNPQLVNEEIVFLKLKELCLLLVKTPQSNAVKELFLALFESVKFNLLGIVDKNYLEDLSISELASLSNMSTPSFKRKFKQLVGESPSRYIRNKRLKLACDELKNTSKNVSEIAFDCGYNDPNYFTKSFSKRFGLSPTEYRST